MVSLNWRYLNIFLVKFCRDGKTRTRDPLGPKPSVLPTELHPDIKSFRIKYNHINQNNPKPNINWDTKYPADNSTYT